MRATRTRIMSLFLTGVLAVGVTVAQASNVGAHVSGALGDNPALLGFAPVFTLAADVDAAIPGVSGLQSLIDEWYDEDTQQLSIRLDFSSQQKAEETMATLNKAISTLSNAQGSGITGITIGRVGLGATSAAATNAVDRSSVVADASTSSGFSGALDLTLSGLERVDAVVAIGVPIVKSVAFGASAKMSRFYAEEIAIKATVEELQDDSDAAAPKSLYEVGEGLLFDAGLALNLRYLQADVALKDIGSVEWKAEQPPWDEEAVVGAVRVHDKPMHVAAGLVLKPFRSLDLSARYDQNPMGSTVMRAEAAVRPVRWLTFKAGQVAVDGEPAYVTLGGGIRLWAFGLDAGIAAKDDVIVGGRARLSIGF